MAEPLVDRICASIDQATGLYYRLIVVVGPSGSGKTVVMEEVKARTGAPLINIGLELARRMLDMPERQRMLRLRRIFSEIGNGVENEIVLFDNIEILFDVSLKQDPLRLLQGISRNKTVVASWNGSCQNSQLVYARPGHPEYRHYPTSDFLVVGIDQAEKGKTFINFKD